MLDNLYLLLELLMEIRFYFFREGKEAEGAASVSLLIDHFLTMVSNVPTVIAKNK